MHLELDLRPARKADFLQLSELRWEVRAAGDGEIPAVTRAEFVSFCTGFLTRSLADGRQAIFVGVQDDLVISQISIHRVALFPRPAKLDDSMGIITENYTRPNYRNRGIGSRLLNYAIEWSREQDFELLIVYPSKQAVPFYKRAGFSIENEVMELRLREYYSSDWNRRS